MANPKYTITVCNYNMVETVEDSLRSILNQLDGNENFEILVIDDGSTDGSQDILDNLEEEYDMFRWVEGSNNNLAEARNHSFEEARGEFVLESLDTDEKYDEVIEDFVEIYEQLDNQIDREFFLSAKGMNIAPRSLLLEIPYRSMGYGEDRDLWRRLKAEDKIISMDNKPLSESIGYDRNSFEKINVSIERTIVEFQSGVGLLTYYKRLFRKDKVSEDYLKLAILPLLFLYSVKKGRYESPENYEELESFEELRDGLKLSEIEKKYSVDIDWSKVSGKGQDCFSL